MALVAARIPVIRVAIQELFYSIVSELGPSGKGLCQHTSGRSWVVNLVVSSVDLEEK